MKHKKRIQINEEGSAMVLTLIVLMILMIFCLLLCLISYSFLSTANKRQQQEQSKQSAITLSKALEQQIVSPEFADNATQEAHASEEKYALWFYLRYNIWQSSWRYFNGEERGHTENYAYRYFNLKDTPGTGIDSELQGAMDNADICIYWSSEVDNGAKTGTPLTVRVTCNRGNQSYTVTSQYDLTVENYSDGSDTPETVAASELNPSMNKIITSEKWEWSLSSRE